MGEGGRGGSVSRSLGAIGRVARWEARSYLQISVLAAAGYLACVVLSATVFGWPRSGAFGVVGAAGGFVGAAAGQSHRLHRRRTG